jgi:hypothetical protein
MIAASTLCALAVTSAAHALNWQALGPPSQGFGIVPMDIYGPATMGANVIGGNAYTGSALSPDTHGGQMEYWDGNAWLLIDSSYNVLATNSDFNQLIWAVLNDPASCPVGYGHAYWSSYSFLGWSWHQLDQAHPQCVRSVAAGNVCLNASDIRIGRGAPPGCNDNEIYAIGESNAVLQWSPTASEWVSAVATAYSGPDLTEIALSTDTGCQGNPNLWVLDKGLNVHEAPSVRARRGLFCTRPGWSSQQPPGCAPTSNGIYGPYGAYSITTDYVLCANDLFHWDGTAWQAQNVGTCPSAFYGWWQVPMTFDGSAAMLPQIGWSPGENLVCWGAAPTVVSGMSGQYTYQLVQ